ncbi:hypothetical protein BDR26DRAFT_923026 [Obelidium mucronatum]|nr:hypothetical protein BDR26DRAFT_923026 [Obelidium mucronatum]
MIKPPQSSSISDHSLRLQLLYTLNDILLFGVDAYATRKTGLKVLRDSLCTRNVDDLIWNLVFHKKIEELRAGIQKASQTDPDSIPSATRSLLSFLTTATTFYRSLIQSVAVYCTESFNLPLNVTNLFLETRRRSQFDYSAVRTQETHEFMKLVQRIVFKSVVYLGDLERYKATYDIENRNLGKWRDVNSIYEYAMRIDPEQGKPQSQLAIVATTCKKHLDALYWYSLSIANVTPLQLAKGNLFTFHQKVTSRLKPITTETDVKISTLDTLSSAIIQFHRLYLFHPDDSRISTVWDLETYSSAAALQSIIYTLVEKFVGSGAELEAENENEGIVDDIPVSKEVSEILLKMIIVFITAFTELGSMFGEKDKAPQVRQKIRDMQCIILSTLFRVSSTCLTRLNSYTTQSDTNSPNNDETSFLFAPMAILCSWAYSTFLPITTDSGVSMEPLVVPLPNSRNSQRTSGERSAPLNVVTLDVFSLFLKYTTGNGVSEIMKQQSNAIFKFSRALATLSTTLLSFADVDGDPKTLPEDVPLLGFAPLKPYFVETLNANGLKRALEHGVSSDESSDVEYVVSRSSRVLALAKRMSERKEVDFFAYEDASKGAGAAFTVRDEESKRIARLKTAKTLALQLLKTQISNLETDLISSTSIPVTTTYIPDTSIYTNHLPLIKKLLIPRQGGAAAAGLQKRILVPMDVVHHLDHLKKGSGGVHARAREATRYLEQRFRFGSEYLVSQQSGETVKDVQYVAPVSARVLDGAEEEEDGSYYTTPPKYLKSFLGCSMYFRGKGVEVERERVKRLQELGVDIVTTSDVDLKALDHGRVFVLSEDEEVIEECRRCGVAVKTVSDLRKSGEYGRRW